MSFKLNQRDQPFKVHFVDKPGDIVEECLVGPKSTFPNFLALLSDLSSRVAHKLTNISQPRFPGEGFTLAEGRWWFRITRAADPPTTSEWKVLNNHAAYDNLLAEMTLGVGREDAWVEIQHEQQKLRDEALASYERSRSYSSSYPCTDQSFCQTRLCDGLDIVQGFSGVGKVSRIADTVHQHKLSNCDDKMNMKGASGDITGIDIHNRSGPLIVGHPEVLSETENGTSYPDPGTVGYQTSQSSNDLMMQGSQSTQRTEISQFEDQSNELSGMGFNPRHPPFPHQVGGFTPNTYHEGESIVRNQWFSIMSEDGNTYPDAPQHPTAPKNLLNHPISEGDEHYGCMYQNHQSRPSWDRSQRYYEQLGYNEEFMHGVHYRQDSQPRDLLPPFAESPEDRQVQNRQQRLNGFLEVENSPLPPQVGFIPHHSGPFHRRHSTISPEHHHNSRSEHSSNGYGYSCFRQFGGNHDTGYVNGAHEDWTASNCYDATPIRAQHILPCDQDHFTKAATPFHNYHDASIGTTTANMYHPNSPALRNLPIGSQVNHGSRLRYNDLDFSPSFEHQWYPRHHSGYVQSKYNKRSYRGRQQNKWHSRNRQGNGDFEPKARSLDMIRFGNAPIVPLAGLFTPPKRKARATRKIPVNQDLPHQHKFKGDDAVFAGMDLAMKDKLKASAAKDKQTSQDHVKLVQSECLDHATEVQPENQNKSIRLRFTVNNQANESVKTTGDNNDTIPGENTVSSKSAVDDKAAKQLHDRATRAQRRANSKFTTK